MLTSISGKSVIVTGASKGIGKGIAKVFAAQGGKIMVAARTKADIDATVAELRGAGGTAEGCVADVADWASVEAMVKAA
ncbi:MAG: SDR family NAD(P)-dependent oxidoreductase, partial [Pseudomonadota bacterium]